MSNMTGWSAGWRAVRVDRSGVGVTAVRVEPLGGGTFLLHTRQPGGEFDVWLESEEDLVAMLAEYVFVDQADATGR